MPQAACDDDPYIEVVKAILHRAVQDAQGHCWSPGAQSPDQIQAEAQVAALVELCGLDAAPVLTRVRRLLAHKTERNSA
jgi:hypothetical protein